MKRCQEEMFTEFLTVGPLCRNGKNSHELAFEDTFMTANYIPARGYCEFDVFYHALPGKPDTAVRFIVSVGDWSRVPFHNLMVKLAAREFFFILSERSPVFQSDMLPKIGSVHHLFKDLVGGARPEHISAAKLRKDALAKMRG